MGLKKLLKRKRRHEMFNIRNVSITWVVGLLLILFPCLTNADPLDYWHWRNPVPPGETLNGVAYGNGTFVVVGEAGTVFTSPNGLEWTLGTSGGAEELRGVAYGNGLFVAVGRYGRILTSPNGIAWTRRESGTADFLLGVAFGNGIFAAVGDRGTVTASSDGMNWDVERAGKTDWLRGITYANGVFVAVGFDENLRNDFKESATIFTSTDGRHWERMPTGSRHPLYGVAYGNGRFVAVGFGAVASSSDGVTWNDTLIGATYFNVTFGNGIFVATGWGTIATSSDGVTWEPQSLSEGEPLYGAGFANGTFIVAGKECYLFASSDGMQWTGGKRAGIRSNLNEVAYGGGIFVAVGSDGMLTSLDGGVSWQQIPEYRRYSSAVAFGKGVFVVVTEGGPILTSPDGVHWTPISFDKYVSLHDVAYGNGMFVAVGAYILGGYDLFLTSVDGLTWAETKLETVRSLFTITYGNGVFVVRGNRIVLTSGDGITWKESKPNEGPSAITYGNDIFVGRGDGIMWTSPDGVNWTKATSTDSFCVPDIVFGGNVFVAAGVVCDTTIGVILSSSDGKKWTARSVGDTVRFRGVAYGENTFVGVGDDGIVLQSDHVEGPHILVEPASIDFGRPLLGAVPEKILKVRNSGTEDLLLGTVEPPSGPFGIVVDGCSGSTLKPGEDCSITLHFVASTSIGTCGASLSILSSDIDRPRVAVSLTGKTIAPDLRATWTSLIQVCTAKCKVKGTLDIQNIGNMDAPSSNVRFYLSDDGINYTEDSFLKQIATGKIKPGTTKTKTFSHAFSTGQSASGRYVVAVVDKTDTIAEADEANNHAAAVPMQAP
jgi:hypothetical protein